MRSRVVALTIAVLAVGLTACVGTPPTAPSSGASATDDDHGDRVGATELTEPPLGLTMIDEAGTVTHLDLWDESIASLGTIAPPRGIASDGRYVFAETATGIEIVDSGVWTWDHVDHFHYYRASPEILGTVAGHGPAVVATTNQSTSGSTGIFFEGSGEAVLLDTEALSRGELSERFRLEVAPHDGLVVPVGSFAVVTEAGPDGRVDRVAGYADDGAPEGIQVACPDARGTITTRVGAVIGCRDAALLAEVTDGELTLTRIPYPPGTTAAPAESFHNREGRPTAAALAGESGANGIWLLDTRAQAWTLLPSPEPLVTVTAVDDDADTVLALTTEGRLIVLDGTDGAVRARTEPLVAASVADSGAHAPPIVADAQRAYVSGPREQKLFEIDFADDARIARTFDTAAPFQFTAGTGR
ncbi:ABC transporter [Microbacterium sp. ET2]|uniref:ABC transporter n=1 Tax=Microbacterium albipurpureum TaxID=3050384 RepID=UPI00259C91B0|nr:ABC transporter [Microbacterium sp. ET2 (Ac-2212)]WJL94294.1 ABC transporter [Microbacterium sp. ET2 (Ac-2212)]